MSAPRLHQGAGAPSFCWHCMNQLRRAPGRGLGLFFFAIVRDRDGVEHRVHGDCVRGAAEDGAKLVPEVQA